MSGEEISIDINSLSRNVINIPDSNRKQLVLQMDKLQEVKYCEYVRDRFLKFCDIVLRYENYETGIAKFQEVLRDEGQIEEEIRWQSEISDQRNSQPRNNGQTANKRKRNISSNRKAKASKRKSTKEFDIAPKFAKVWLPTLPPKPIHNCNELLQIQVDCGIQENDAELPKVVVNGMVIKQENPEQMEEVFNLTPTGTRTKMQAKRVKVKVEGGVLVDKSVARKKRRELALEEQWYDVTCFCGKPYMGRPMIECEMCMVWVHMSCAHVDENNPPKPPEPFSCFMCRKTRYQKRRKASGSSGFASPPVSPALPKETGTNTAITVKVEPAKKTTVTKRTARPAGKPKKQAKSTSRKIKSEPSSPSSAYTNDSGCKNKRSKTSAKSRRGSSSSESVSGRRRKPTRTYKRAPKKRRTSVPTDDLATTAFSWIKKEPVDLMDFVHSEYDTEEEFRKGFHASGVNGCVDDNPGTKNDFEKAGLGSVYPSTLISPPASS